MPINRTFLFESALSIRFIQNELSKACLHLYPCECKRTRSYPSPGDWIDKSAEQSTANDRFRFQKIRFSKEKVAESKFDPVPQLTGWLAWSVFDESLESGHPTLATRPDWTGLTDRLVTHCKIVIVDRWIGRPAWPDSDKIEI